MSDLSPPEIINGFEALQYEASDRTSEMGRSSILIRCPFCRGYEIAYLWSLAGCGKKCTTEGCGTKFDYWGRAYRPVRDGDAK